MNIKKTLEAILPAVIIVVVLLVLGGGSFIAPALYIYVVSTKWHLSVPWMARQIALAGYKQFGSAKLIIAHLVIWLLLVLVLPIFLMSLGYSPDPSDSGALSLWQPLIIGASLLFGSSVSVWLSVFSKSQSRAYTVEGVPRKRLPQLCRIIFLGEDRSPRIFEFVDQIASPQERSARYVATISGVRTYIAVPSGVFDTAGFWSRVPTLQSYVESA